MKSHSVRGDKLSPPCCLNPPFGVSWGDFPLAWGLRWLGFDYFKPLAAPYQFHLYFCTPAVSELFSFLTSPRGWKYLAVIFQMGLFNVIGSLQNLESAEAAGDRFETRPSLLANGLGSLCAAGLGSAFPTTILVSMILAALLAFIIDRSFLKAGLWALTATALSAFGVIHAYDLTAAGVQNKFGWLAAPQFVAGYGLTALVLIGLHFHRRTRRHGLRTVQNHQGFHVTALTRIRA